MEHAARDRRISIRGQIVAKNSLIKKITLRENRTANALPLGVAARSCDDNDECMARSVSSLPRHDNDDDDGHLPHPSLGHA